MAISPNSFKFGNRTSRIVVPSQDDDGSPDGDVSKALLADEDNYDSPESPPPYRFKHGRAIGSKWLVTGLAALTLLFGLLALCFFWHMATLKTENDRTEVQETHQSIGMTTKTPTADEDPDGLVSEMDESIFAGWKDCGSSVEEARSKGCFFDVMLHSWVPEDCFDKELMDDYLTKIPYHWYRDSSFKEEITVDEMRRGEHGSAAVKLEEHATHCAYVLDKNLRATMGGKSFTRSIFSVKHTVGHCLGILVDPSTIPGVYTKVAVEYDQCGVPHFS